MTKKKVNPILIVKPEQVITKPATDPLPDIVVEPVVEKVVDVKEQALNDFIQLRRELSGRTRMQHGEAVRMFDIYNRYYNAHENNYTCDLCAIRLYSRLSKLVQNK